MSPSTRPPRVLLLYTTTGYQAEDFLKAARRLEIETLIGTDRCHVLEDPWADGAIPLRFEDPEAAVRSIIEAAERAPLDAIVPIGDRPTWVAALAAQALGLVHNPPGAVASSRNKLRSRRAFQAAGLRAPAFSSHPITVDPRKAGLGAPYPCVLKPLALGASRGVIRANDPEEFEAAFRRVAALLTKPEIRAMRDEANGRILVEGFIEGREAALEGLMERGRLRPLALFDKPDPMDGPFFEETIYVTPSRLDKSVQDEIVRTAEAAARSVGLLHGPVHAEMRVNAEGVWILEVAARPIGGLCSRALKFAGGLALEEVILRHSLGLKIESDALEGGASGVMMIPIPEGGILHRVDGLEEARGIDGVEEVTLTAKIREILVPLPEGSSYLGFIFARGPSPERTEESLRKAHRALRFSITPGMVLD